MPNPNQNAEIKQFCCVILMFILPLLFTGSYYGVMAGFRKRWRFCPLSHLPGVCPLLRTLCFHTVLAWGPHMKYLVWETSIGLWFGPRISAEGLIKGLAPSRMSPFSFCSLYSCGMMSRSGHQAAGCWCLPNSRSKVWLERGASLLQGQVILESQLVLLGQCCVWRCWNTTWPVLGVQLILVGWINKECFVDVKCESFMLNISGITKSSFSRR